MKILQISSARNFGGGERHLVDLINGLQRRGHEVFLAAPEDSPVAEKLDRFPPERLLPVRIKNSADILSSAKIARFIRQNKIEIAHAHAAKDYLPASFAVRLAPGAKFVLTRHVLFPMKKMQRFALSNAARAVAVSTAVAAGLENIFPKEKIVKIPNGIEIERWRDAESEKLSREFRALHNLPEKAPLVVTMGELKVLKGQRDFVLAAAETAKRFPAARFLIVGADNTFKKDFRRELKRLVKILGLEERFLFLDWVEDTRPLLAATDVFVSASHTESFGLAILEAMASRKAVVATETMGARELIEDGKTGRLTRVQQPLELAAAIGEFLSDEKMRARFGESAVEAAGERFSLEKMIGRTEELYRSVLV